MVGLWALSVGMVAVGPVRAEPGATIDRVVVPARPADDFAAAPRATAARRAVLYVNFDGGALSYGLDDSRANITAIEERAGNFPDYGGTAQRAAVLQAVEADFDGYDVVVVDERPDGGDYTMAMVGPAGEKGVLGVALLDCNDDSPNNIVFAYHSDGDGYSAASQANTISQEVAHSFGLEHVDHPGDIMYPQSTGGDPVFLDACLAIVPADDIVCTAQHRRHCDAGFQNAFRELYELLGPSSSDAEVPVVYLSSPEDGAELPVGEPFEITARAFDDHAIANVVLFVDDVNVGSDMVAPYTWPISGQNEGIVEAYAIAVDEAGNMGRSEPIELYIGIDNPDADHHRGCSVAAPRDAAAPTWAGLLALLGLRRRRR
ncbi:MAG: Ig-like domain-containing protein [Nannocystaceae bacterium]